MRLLTIAGMLAAVLTGFGCASPAEIRAADARQCSGYGFSPGTDSHAACIQKIEGDRAKQMQAFMGNAPGSTTPAASTTECRDKERGTSTTNSSSTSTTTGVPGNSTTTGSSSSTTSSSSSGFSLCVNK